MLAFHATPKPVELCVDAILDVTARGEIVLDVFLGSGTSLIAADKTDRRCFGMEIDPGFVDVAIERWQQHTGSQAILDATGETFKQTRARRRADQPSSSVEVAND
jgi:DNA modification methylase